MAKYNAGNERLKRKYFEWEEEANGKSESTVNNMRSTLYDFEKSMGFKDLDKVGKLDFINFKKMLKQKRSKRTNALISKTHLLHSIQYVMNFFQWLCMLKGYKRKIEISDINYLNLSSKEVNIARSSASKRYPTIEQIVHVIKSMPTETDIQKRNRAVVAFLLLTGCRVTALISLKLKHVFLDDKKIEQDPEEVKTKFSKKIVTYFFPVGDLFEDIFVEWVHFLKKEKHFDYDMPLFPRAKLSLDENDQFSRNELDCVGLKSTTAIRIIIKDAFENAGLQYYHPHAFRDTLVHLGYDYCKTPEECKAWSQNLGHGSLLTTFTSYGHIEEYNQGEIIKNLGKDDDNRPLTKKDLIDLFKAQNK